MALVGILGAGLSGVVMGSATASTCLRTGARLQAQDGSQSVVDGIDQRPGQPAHTLRQPGAIDQLQSERYCNGVGRQASHGSVEQDIAGETSPVEV